MDSLLKSKSIKFMGYCSFLIIAFEIIFAIIPNQQLSYITSIFSAFIIGLIGPIVFIIFLLRSRNIERKKFGFFKGLGIILLFAIIGIFIALPLASISLSISPDVPANEIADIALVNPIGVFFLILWQLLGEEAIKFSMFFLIYKGVVYNENKKNKFWISWLIVSILFGLLHLSTYGNNFIHCILVIGLPTMLYAVLWKLTSRPSYLWLTHVTYDLILLSMAFILI